jgi:hypothetical protein
MMDFFGKWTVKDIMMFGREGMKYVPVEKIRGSIEGEEYAELINAVVIISADGIKLYSPISEDQIEEAKAAGAPLTEHGILAQSSEVKEENGEYYYDSRTEGEVGGEEISRFVKLELDADGFLPFAGGMCRLKKAE